jgi:hypothetical protein
MPQYHPIQPVPPRNEQQQQQQQKRPQTNIFPPYGQFPSTYPYNTLNPQFFEQQSNLQQNNPPNISAQPVTVNPSAGMYAPIPFVGQSLHPGMQNVMTYPSNGQPFRTESPSKGYITVEINSNPISREGVYVDDTRNVKRPKIELKRILPLFDLTDSSYSDSSKTSCAKGFDLLFSLLTGRNQ